MQKERSLTAVMTFSPGLCQISLPFQGEEEIIGAYLLSGNNELALIDPGPGSTAEALLKGMKEAGFEPGDVTHLLVTHIHLDHAGAIGALLPHMPKATVYAHSKGVQHLVKPDKFLASARRIFGEQMQQLWGEMTPVPEERLKPLEDKDILQVAGRRLEVHYTPGHAIHHVVFFDAHAGELFTGDIAGVRLPNISYVRPPTPPPDFDLEEWFASIDKIKQLYPDVLYLAHFGPNKKPLQHLEKLREKLTTWGNYILEAMREGKNEEEIVQMLTTQADPELVHIVNDRHVAERYDLATSYAMTVQGYQRYWRKKHPELFSNPETR